MRREERMSEDGFIIDTNQEEEEEDDDRRVKERAHDMIDEMYENINVFD
jgi:hypothetical protein